MARIRTPGDARADGRTTGWRRLAAAARSLPARTLRHALAALLALAVPWAVLLPASAAHAALNPAPGGPVLVVTSASAPNGDYYAEILRAEGLNAFGTADVAALTPALLAAHDVVLLARVALTPAQASLLSDWVQAGGSLIAMAPDAQLAPLLGITPTGTTLADGYMKVVPAQSAAAGITAETMQFHGLAQRHALAGASAVANLYTSVTGATGEPAVTLRQVGAGTAVAFVYDLATSIVQTRQGNPAWAAQERDGLLPIRADDKFYGARSDDPQPDWVDPTRLAIPQADEQQRLLANLIVTTSQARQPLPRFWYFPKGKRAVVVMTGDDHANNGTGPRFEQFLAASPAGCSVADWECVRGTSYIYANTPLPAAQAQAYAAQGFELALHASTDCQDYTGATLAATYASQLGQLAANFPGLPASVTQRHHCVVWSDWDSGAQVQAANGIRLDTSYYFYPPAWVGNVPGLFNGTAMPMRFASATGSLIDVYLTPTQMTDESGQDYPYTIDTLLDRALGPLGYYGVYTVNAHTDLAASPQADAVVVSAQSRGVPIVSARQLLAWLDARNGATFDAITYTAPQLAFTINAGVDARGLRAMLPLWSGARVLQSITRSGAAVPFTVETVKGIAYASFDAVPGPHVASWGVDTSPPGVTATAPTAGQTGVATSTVITATFGEALDAASVSGATVQLRDGSGTLVAGTVGYDAATRTIRLQPTAPLATSTAYTVALVGAPASPRLQDVAGNALAPYTWTFQTAAVSDAPTCPCGGFIGSTAVPATPVDGDTSAVELGVKFRASVNGYITGVRFYKGGSANAGPHTGSLWTQGGTRLATATFSGETASGWQEVSFASPVAITANTVYVASYYAPAGRYAGDNGYFQASGAGSGPIRLLRDGEAGGNGVYRYGVGGGFPDQSYFASNYWVDVVFTTTVTADTTPPTITAVTPAAGATGVSVSTPVSVQFSEAIDPASLTAATIALRTSAGVAVPTSIAWDAASRTATLTPAASLGGGATYQVFVAGGASGARVLDLAGNALAAPSTTAFTTQAPPPECVAPANAIVAENCRAGTPSSQWDITGAGDPTIQGYATDISVAAGSPIAFKVDTDAAAWKLDIYRLGYYGGLGARQVATVLPSATLPQSQPACLGEAATGLVDCGNWAVSATWSVPAGAVSGVYVAKVTRLDTGGASHIVFIVRDDAATGKLLFQTSDTTWQAYNDYGGNSLYKGQPAGRAYKVSYNRPFNTRAVDGGQDWLFNAEYPMIRWLERNGYDVRYASGVDSDRRGAFIAAQRAFLSVGHDEYWSAGQRTAVEAARAAGVHLAFFSGNEVYWKTRWESSIAPGAAAYRTLVSYKETHANARIDPTAAWTGTWRDPRFSPPADGGRPENALTGTLFMVNEGATTAIRVPAANGKLRFWRNTAIANLSAGTTATLAPETLGYEWDVDADNAVRPAGLVRLSDTSVTTDSAYLQDYGSTFGAGTANHALTLYRHASGALVFGAGTVQWTWGLDATHDRTAVPVDARMQQASVNLLADMGLQPATLQSGLVAATASTDTTGATAVITSPASGTAPALGASVTFTGTASDVGGQVAGIEISLDGGASWRRVPGLANWSYTTSFPTAGSRTVQVRAVDDSANLQATPASVTVNVGGTAAAPTIQARTPAPGATGVATTTAISVQFSVAMDPASLNAATLRLTSASGTAVGSTIAWNATTRTATLQPAAALAAGQAYSVTVAGGAGGVKSDAGATLAATSSWSLTTAGGDVTALTVTARYPAAGATSVPVSASILATMSEATIDPATVTAGTFTVRSAAGVAVAGAVVFDPALRRLALNPSTPLADSTTYTATVRGGASGIRDLAGNALAADVTWSFTTAAPTAPAIGSRSPAPGATGIGLSTWINIKFNKAMDPTTLNTATIVLADAAGTVIPGTVSYDTASFTATRKQTVPLIAGRTYTVTVAGGASGVRSSAGVPLAASSTWSFTTAPDVTAPTVTARTPAAGATNVVRSVVPAATLSEATIDPASVSATTFTLTGPGGVAVAASVSFDPATRRISLVPAGLLAPSSAYTATLRGGPGGLRDLAGNALAADASWSFTTRP